jgi:hypothetical protein
LPPGTVKPFLVIVNPVIPFGTNASVAFVPSSDFDFGATARTPLPNEVTPLLTADVFARTGKYLPHASKPMAVCHVVPITG